MLPRAASRSWLCRASTISYTQCTAALEAALELQGSGWRAAATTSGGGGGAGRRERAAGYLKEKERRQAAATAPAGDPPPRSRLAEAAADFAEAQQTQQALMLSSPSGLGVGAEAAIAQAIKDGALDDLPGKGKPLKQEDHGVQFYRVDPLVQAVTRTMGAQNVRPLSLELQEELQRELAALRAQLAAELLAAKAGEASAAAAGAGGKRDAADSGSSSSGDGGAGGSWFGRWLGGGGGSHSSGGSGGRQRRSVAAIRAGQHAGLAHAAEKVGQLIRQYNSAVLADKEAFGAFWPLNPAKQLDWAAEVDAALAAVEKKGSNKGGHTPNAS
ncbi:hypothetical protein ABPG75_006916 [Micractinium tetrahymenae]